MRRTTTRALAAFFAVAVLVAAAGCGGEEEPSAPFELTLHPEFVQGALPGVPVTVLVTVEDTDSGAGDVTLEARFTGGAAEVEPQQITEGEIAEVTLTADAVTEELEAELTVTATRGSVQQTATRAVVVMPIEDELGPMAADLLALFAGWLAEAQPDLGITPERQFEGSLVAPRLLIVSHYMFEDAQYELGLSWHVTIQPHDWAELYVRPRDEVRPTRAFRVSSWTAALAGEAVEYSEVTPPEEIVR